MRWVVVVGLVGCYAPAPPEGAPCGEGLRRCPTGQTCNSADDRCHADPPAGDGATATDGSAGVCVPRRLLAGGQAVEGQGWTIERAGTGTVTYGGGVTALSTTENARQLIVLRDAFPSTEWSLMIMAQVVQSGGCTASHAAAAFMAGFHGPVGDTADRARMLCASEGSVSWGDGSVSIGVSLDTLAQIKLERTANGIRANVLASGGMGTITGSNFTSNGTIAIGDQTTEPGLDSMIRLVSVDLTCP
ncbi:MAG TPA: hypothetical protein VNO30_22280 [Kofleriaceae bacterium]|nr:hypothetical protein [Kofleriaceae bacterium]